MQKIAIIGAGVSGLSAAHFLKDKYEVTVFEKKTDQVVLLSVVELMEVCFILVADMFSIQNDRMY